MVSACTRALCATSCAVQGRLHPVDFQWSGHSSEPELSRGPEGCRLQGSVGRVASAGDNACHAAVGTRSFRTSCTVGAGAPATSSTTPSCSGSSGPQPAPTAARPGQAHPGRVRTRLHHQHRRRPGSMISPQPPSSEAAAVPQVVCLPATGFWPYVRAPDQAERRVPVIFKVRSGGVSFSRRCLLSCEAPACAGRAPASRATSRTPDATSGGPGQRLAHEPRAESSWGSPAAPGRARRGRPRPARGRG